MTQIELLIDTGYDLNLTNRDGNSALMCASFHTNTLVVQKLIKKGANVNLTNRIGNTALHYAASTSIDIVQELINTGADINVIEFQDYTPLFIAVLNNNLDMVKLLIESGADISIVPDANKNLLDYTHSGFDKKLLKYLKKVIKESKK